MRLWKRRSPTAIIIFENIVFDDGLAISLPKNVRGSSEYSDQSYDYQIEPSPDTSPMRDSSPPPSDCRDCLPQPQPLSYTELNRLPVVQLKGQDLTVKCCCDKPWEKDEEVTLLLCGHHLHSTCACKLMETGICPICKSPDVIEDKLREIRIDLSGFNF